MQEQRQDTSATAVEEALPRPRRQELQRVLGRPMTLAGLVIVLLFVTTALIGIFVTPRPPDAVIYTAVLAPPSPSYPFGTDDLGRDILSRVIAGAHISLMVGVISIGLAMI